MSDDQFNPVRVIERKRDGHPLTAEEIDQFIQRYASGNLPDYQMAALAMAIYLQGLSLDETVCLTDSMLRSGSRLTWSPGRPVVDKHSTGGVGDKVSLVLTPLLACCGLRVPMISGRGLGITGGTLDKLESIAGFRTDLSLEEIQRQVERVGCVITGTTPELVPADRKLYTLRDVTGTVGSVPLITASILSKKLAEGLDALVLDVKCGRGTFMKTLEQARRLARCLVTVGHRMGTRTTALITNMDQPLGRAVGNAVEVQEAVDVLKGQGPEDVWTLTVELAAELLQLTGQAANTAEARKRLNDLRRSGRPWEKFEEMVRAQGGDLRRPLPRAPEVAVTSGRSGVVVDVDAGQIGQTVADLGGGRRTLNAEVDHAVGVELVVRVGDPVRAGDLLARVFAYPEQAERARAAVAQAVRVEDKPPPSPVLVLERVAEEGSDAC